MTAHMVAVSIWMLCWLCEFVLQARTVFGDRQLAWRTNEGIY